MDAKTRDLVIENFCINYRLKTKKNYKCTESPPGSSCSEISDNDFSEIISEYTH